MNHFWEILSNQKGISGKSLLILLAILGAVAYAAYSSLSTTAKPPLGTNLVAAQALLQQTYSKVGDPAMKIQEYRQLCAENQSSCTADTETLQRLSNDARNLLADYALRTSVMLREDSKWTPQFNNLSQALLNYFNAFNAELENQRRIKRERESRLQQDQQQGDGGQGYGYNPQQPPSGGNQPYWDGQNWISADGQLAYDAQTGMWLSLDGQYVWNGQYWYSRDGQWVYNGQQWVAANGGGAAQPQVTGGGGTLAGGGGYPGDENVMGMGAA